MNGKGPAGQKNVMREPLDNLPDETIDCAIERLREIRAWGGTE